MGRCVYTVVTWRGGELTRTNSPSSARRREFQQLSQLSTRNVCQQLRLTNKRACVVAGIPTRSGFHVTDCVATRKLHQIVLRRENFIRLCCDEKTSSDCVATRKLHQDKRMAAGHMATRMLSVSEKDLYRMSAFLGLFEHLHRPFHAALTSKEFQTNRMFTRVELLPTPSSLRLRQSPGDSR
ncbi:hypothetical protein RRG08_015980 [Elysia crispata]|uniref:Uncharacterized protein n=1 Tax=Elysia crispata TaxID=231223 RepID=A0AAE1CWW5_9GAST|nr:hypothetical protein RRG08_015980 [Elysia crispata]